MDNDNDNDQKKGNGFRKTVKDKDTDKEVCHHQNKNKRLEWMIPEEMKIDNVFNDEVLHCIPFLDDGNNTCIHFHSKCYYVNNCKHKESHKVLPS